MSRYSEAYLLRTVSPLHVGSGDANYGIVDKLVQRDAITNRPVIHSSSLKGALREYFTYKLSQGILSGQAPKMIRSIFGSEADERNIKAEAVNEKGKFDFDFAYLLSIPVRCSVLPYVSATSPDILETAIERMSLFGIKSANNDAVSLLNRFYEAGKLVKESKPLVFRPDLEGAVFEDGDIKGMSGSFEELSKVERILGKNPVIMHDNDLDYLLEKLPVIARNRLENGESKNLWYEEVVPRESRFYCIVTKDDSIVREKEIEIKLDGWFNTAIPAGTMTQIGANATVGYGQTQFFSLNSNLLTI